MATTLFTAGAAGGQFGRGHDLVLLTSVVQEHRLVTLDLSQTNFVDSTGLAALIEARNRLNHEGIALTVLNPSAAFVHLLTASGIEGFFDVEYDLPPDAMSSAEAS